MSDEHCGRTEYGWLVEENGGGSFIHWIALSEEPWPKTKLKHRRDWEIEEYISPITRTKNASEALRFARKEDAEAFIKLFDRFLLTATATEHAWDYPASETAS